MESGQRKVLLVGKNIIFPKGWGEYNLLGKISVVDPDPHGSGTFAWIRIQQKVKEHINKTVNSGLFLLLDSSIE